MSSPDDRRQAILLAVWQILAAQGLGAVSIRSVAAAAQVSPGLVQHHFGTKDRLLLASAELMIDLAEGGFAEVRPSMTPHQELEQLLLHALPRADEAKAGTSVYYAFVAASVAQPPIASLLAQAKQGVVGEVTRLLEQLAPGRGSGQAASLVALSDGVTMAVFLGALDPAQATAAVRAALDQALTQGR